MAELKKKPLFNPEGDIDVRLRRMIGGNTTNLNDFNNMKYPWVSDWYRQAMNNFWIPEEINLSQDVKDYPPPAAGRAHGLRQNFKLSRLSRLHPDGESSQHRRVYYRQRGQSLPLHSGVSGVRPLPEL